MESFNTEMYIAELQKMESPFTWEMDEIKKTIDTDYHEHDDEEFFPLLKLIRNLMSVYVNVKENEDFEIIQDLLYKCNENMEELKTKVDPGVSTNAVLSVLVATKSFIYLKFGMKEALNKLLKEFNDENWPEEDKYFKSTLIGCKSLSWSIYHEHGSFKAEKFIREAIKLNPNYHLWYYILGKNLRRIRRDSCFISSPSEEESASFIKSYELSNNALYGVFVAQMYREKKDDSKAANMYKKVLDSNPKSTTILMRSALGLIRLEKFELAKKCLDKVSKENSSSSMYLHYMGIYHMKLCQPKIAVNYLKKATKTNNLKAEKDYMKCMMRINPNFNVINFLLQTVQKYSKLFPEKRTQSIFLDIAFLQWKKKNKIDLALNYFLKAIEIDPEADCLINYFCDVGLKICCKNVYEIIEKDFLPLAQKKIRYDNHSMEAVECLKKYCDNYFNRQNILLRNDFSKFSLKKYCDDYAELD